MITAQISLFAFYAARVILLLLGVISVFTVAFFVERMLFFIRNSLRNSSILLREVDKAANRDEVMKLMRENTSNETSVVIRSLESARTSDDFAKKVQAYLSDEKEQWERFLSFLGSVGSNAPFIGLLGTVLGIMKSFADLGTATAANGGPQVVMSGISEALIATAVGLMVAIPAIIFFNICKTKVKKSVAQVGALSDLIASKQIF